VDLPGSVYFAGESTQWGGGMAFYDHTTPGRTAARGYLITVGQLADVAAQEMYRDPRDGDPLEEVLLAPLRDGRHRLGDGRYETLVDVGRLDGHPMVTFTAPHRLAQVDHTPPSAAYLVMLAAGLREARGWSETQVAAYVEGITRPPAGTRPVEG
jgi:hypothetical protein